MAEQKNDRHSPDAEFLKALGSHRDGDRPLTLLDQIERETLDLDLASWLVSHVSLGASYVVGAEPGGVGKTTTMRALLSFAPGDLTFATALPGEISSIDGVSSCVVSHELSDHPPPTYLWGQDLRDYLDLTERGHMLVSNMHADDLDSAYAQIVTANDISESRFCAVNLFIFLRIEGEKEAAHRYINEVCYSDGTTPHRSIYLHGEGLSPEAPRHADREALCRAFLEEMLADSSPPIGEIRRRFVSRIKQR